MVLIIVFQFFKNFLDEICLKIVLLFRVLGEFCVCEFCGMFEEFQFKIFCYFFMLWESGLFIDCCEGKWIYYWFLVYMFVWVVVVIEQVYFSQKEDILFLVGWIVCNSVIIGGRVVCF